MPGRGVIWGLRYSQGTAISGRFLIVLNSAFTDLMNPEQLPENANYLIDEAGKATLVADVGAVN